MAIVEDVSATGGLPPSRKRGYAIVGLLMTLWVVGLLGIALTVIPDGYWYSYFAVDYSQGFIRRGLAGELVHMMPGADQVAALKIVRWFPTGFYIIGLVLLSATVATRWGRSERRLLMALLIPFLPFGFAFSVFSARPDLFGAVTVIGFAVALTRIKSESGVVIASAVYGLTIAVLTLIHEAIPLLFSLGALAALSVLGRELRTRSFWTAAVLAVGPGLLVTATVAVFGRRGVSAELCAGVPHLPMNHPLAATPPPSIGQILRGFRHYVDYHDWVCRSILPLFDQGFGDAARFVADIGVAGLTASTVYGAVLLVVTMYTIRQVSGVPLGQFRRALLRWPLAIVMGFLLILPIFVTGADWIRWWVIIGFDLGVVFALFAASRGQADQAPTRKVLWTFGVCAVVLGILPLGIIPTIGAPVPM